MSAELTEYTTFRPWPKISRLSTAVTVTEKIDGTNALIRVTPPTGLSNMAIRRGWDALGFPAKPITAVVGDQMILAGSRKRWVHPLDDNFGFAAWVYANREELIKLGPGDHYGEWWGVGIQRGYGLDHKRFSLFNTARWSDPDTRPGCCGVVPVLAETTVDTMQGARLTVKWNLDDNGSVAAPGFMRPEGLMFYLHGPGVYLKYPFDK